MQIQGSSSAGRNVATWAAALACIACIACGGDDDDANQGSAGSGSATPTTLTGASAGDACTASSDCGTGSCRKDFTTGGLIGGGSMSAPGGYCTFDCSMSQECGEGGSCVGGSAGGFFTMGAGQSGKGLCLARCTSGADCRDGYRCIDTVAGTTLTGEAAGGGAAPSGTCQIAPETDKLTDSVGNACAADGDCGGGRCATMQLTGTFPGGYCTGSCLTAADCGGKGVCDPGIAGAAGTCFLGCDDDGDCTREGYRCRNGGLTGGAKRCMPGADPLPTGLVGNACTADSECGGAAMSCITRRQGIMGQTTFPGGYCSASCVEDIDCGGGSCVGGFGAVINTALGTCYKTCSDASDCREGYRCNMPQTFGGGNMSRPTVCQPIPPATDDAGVPDADGGT